MPWIRIAAVVLAYVLFALSASWAARKAGLELKQVEGRTSSGILVLGAVTNIGVLLITLLFLALVDGRPIADLGLRLGRRELAFTILAVAATLAGGAAYLWGLRGAGRIQVKPQPASPATLRALAPAMAVLFVVALQEETLFRGYIGLNLLPQGPAVFVVVSSILFTLIHFLTNRVNRWQVMSWFLGGAIFAWVYLVTGSLWVVVLLHFAVDAGNVLIFDIVGRMSLYAITPALTASQRLGYRVFYVAAVLGLLTGAYGTSIALAR